MVAVAERAKKIKRQLELEARSKEGGAAPVSEVARGVGADKEDIARAIVAAAVAAAVAA